MMPVDDGYLSLKALAGYDGLGVRTLRGYFTHPGHPLPHYRIGGKVLVRRSEYDAWASRFHVRYVRSAATVDAIVDDVMRGL